MGNTHESAILSYSPEDSLEARRKIFELMNSYASTDEEKERSLGLFLRGSLLARIFAISEIYQQIIRLPGIIFDIGTWRGQTAVICENLRAIYEPLHFNRRIVCFDTFEGYAGFSEKDEPSDLHKDGTYNIGDENYAQYLEKLLILHEKSNAMGNYNGKHKVIKGDCRVEIPSFFERSPGEILSLAFFDVNAYDPTLRAFEEVWSRLVPGGIVAFWQITRGAAVQAEGRVYAENILTKLPHQIRRTDVYPGLCYIVK